ncbi:peroxisome proliferator-activated receptor gamma coactivator-related protein 1 isoform X2 [Parambassis ranga]|uniref:Peroxisome proliferator-activated receptor gamma coactivator-related protein 1 isoform X2 n=1 Tax=Parambassis ranga TaxID=210632 RepID=A0A6P7J4N8_9TELE|nr:peroxisome proliferator-activated receptor gamma coactivator-related protein 1-like isoform X2 [Parambassis ranga]
MWRSKMAARWRAKDGDLKAGNREFLASNTPNELVPSGVDMDTQSCVDDSILAILEDAAVASECKNGGMEESETLLSALTEMLDSVGDDDRTLSPFDTLPDTKLHSHRERREHSADPSPTARLRPRLKPPNVRFRSDGEFNQECKMEKNSLSQTSKKQSQVLLYPKKKVEPEVEVFTSTSLVNLVRIMHPYCLKLHVEDDKPRKSHTIFSKEEVWKYERPTEETDEEINVVSDDEAPVKETKEEDEVDGNRNDGPKSVLLNGSSPRTPPSRGRKRVSFGSVQVAVFDESEEKELNEKNVTSKTESAPSNSTKALENPADSAPEPQVMDSLRTEAQPLKGGRKAKSLSLQQYRQLRQKRQPLVEKQGNYTTKWPSVSEPPKELTPILCLQGQNKSGFQTKMAHLHPDLHTSDHTSPPPSETKPSSPLRHTGLKRPRSESKITPPASPLIDTRADPSENKKLKKPALLSSDPPNPVLLPLPVVHTASPSTASSQSKVEFLSRDFSLQSAEHLQETQNGSSAVTLHRQTEEFMLKQDLSPDSSTLLQERTECTETPPADSTRSPEQAESASDCKELQPHKCGVALVIETKRAQTGPDGVRSVHCPSLTPHFSRPSSPISVQQNICPSEEPPPPQSSTATADSGIEAADLTSLLEQFEETQAKEENESKHATSPSSLQSHVLLDQPVGSEILKLTPSVETPKPLSTLEAPETQKTMRNLPDVQMLAGVDVPEPLFTEVILSTEQEQPARRRTLPFKAIQIIDPRPLPSKKVHTNPLQSSAAPAYSHVSTDHDYCRHEGHLLVNVAQHSRAQPSVHKDSSTNEQQGMTQDSEGLKQTNRQTNTETREEPPTEAALTVPYALPTPPPSPPVRGRDRRRRYRRRSPLSRSSSCSCSSSSSSSSSSRSPSRSPKRRRRSESSSSSSSYSSSPARHYKWSYSRSRSRSWSGSRSPFRSRSPSPQICQRRWRNVYSRESRKLRREHEIRIQKLKAIDERRVVYVGRIRRTMTHEELRERFSQFGDVECVSLHFRDRGDHYAFVTFYNMEDAFAAIDNGGKLRKPDELPFDICFGGRRQFCNSLYADLDANRDADPSPPKSRFEDLDFDSLLKQAQRGLKT